MDRREAIKRLAFLSGGALSLSTVAGIMGGCTSQKGGNEALQTLSAEQNELVIQLSERIIPATDTPGAKAANVNEFVDLMLTEWNYEEEKEFFLKGLDHVNELSNAQHDSNFVNLDQANQMSIMEALEKEAQNNPNPVPNSDIKPFFSMMKEYTVVGYYTSEIGATKELKSDLVPGYYDACMPYSEVGRAWS